ncbi:CaiB/BaiF CoA transferase family protein [Ramlibacter sp.]|uniref:CaiB/BaiF CoA transferase family protein n=1 Tax=Ramlibacter sp. TaxID=1917967 RepID=UPI003D0ABADA
MAGVLAGIKVVEIAQALAVPGAGRVLAALGADVIKLEPPGGESQRHMDTLHVKGESRPFSSINPGKRSLELDMASPHARPVIDALAKNVDIFLTGMKQPDLARYGIDYERLAVLNPRLIYLQTSAFGAKGPDAQLGGYDILASGLSGLAFLTGRDDGAAPEPVVPAYTDAATSLGSVVAILAALRHRDATGEGQRVHTSLLSTALSMELSFVSRFEEVDPPREREFDAQLAELRARGATPREQRRAWEAYWKRGGGIFDLYFRHYRTADGMLGVGVLSHGLRARFHDAIGIPAPGKDVALKSPEWNAVVERVEALFATRTTQQWQDQLNAAKVPCMRHKLPHQVLDDPQVRANDMVVELDHPTLGRYTTANVPFQLERTPTNVTRPSPELAADNDDVLAEIGIGADDVARLRALGVFGPTP